MSNGSAIATCTAVLQRLFQESLVDAELPAALGATPTVTALAPDRITVGATEVPQLNLFLYNVSPNTGWCNQDLPSHDADGRRRTVAPWAVDLHYVVSAYGTGNMHADVLLGHAALVLHRTRRLSRERIRSLAGNTNLPAALRTILAGSGLDDQEEPVRLAPEPLTIDDIAKLWSVFGERYRTSLGFVASVLILRPEDDSHLAEPVAESNLRVLPLPLAGIDRLDPTTLEVGDTLTIVGHGLVTAQTVIRFGGSVDVAPPAGSTPQRIDVVVPANTTAGVISVEVVHAVDFGPASGLRSVAGSNLAPLIVRPRVAAAGGGGPDVTTSGTTNDGTVFLTGTMTTRVEPDVGRDQRVRILLDELGPPNPHRYALPVPSRALAPQLVSPTVDVDLTGVALGTYLVRVEVDGVPSGLVVGATGAFDGPQVTL